MTASTNNTPEARQSLKLLLSLRSEVRSIEQLLDRELAQWHGVSLVDFLLLLDVFDAPDQTISRAELATKSGERLTDVVKRVRPLQRIGLIAENEDGGKDVRSIPIRLTETGATFVNDSLVTANDVAGGALEVRRRAKSFEALRQILDC